MIPDIFHFVYGFRPQAEPFPLLHFLTIRSCIEVNRPQQVMVHCAERPWGKWWDRLNGEVVVMEAGSVPEVETHEYDARVPDLYRYAHRADFIRLDVLIRYGGIYADVDTVFIRRFPDALRADPFVAGRESDLHGQASVGNAILAAEPGAKFAQRWRGAMAEAIDGWSDHSTLLPARLAAIHRDEVKLEPMARFYPFSYTPLDLLRLLETDEPVPAETISVHLWEHLWSDPMAYRPLEIPRWFGEPTEYPGSEHNVVPAAAPVSTRGCNVSRSPPGVLFAGFVPGTGYGNATRDYLALLEATGCARSVDSTTARLAHLGTTLLGRTAA